MSAAPDSTDGGLPAAPDPIDGRPAAAPGRTRRGRATLPAVAALAFAAGSIFILLLAATSVSGARERATKDVARMAANLWEIPDAGEDAVARYLGERVQIEAVAAGEGTPDAASDPSAYGYRTGALEPSVRISVAPETDRAPWPHPATPFALLGLLLMAAWAVRQRRSPPPPRYPAATLLLAAAFLALVAGAAGRWAHHELEALSASRVAHGIRAAEIAFTSGADSAQAARAAGLPWATTAALTNPTRLWTMPRAVGEAIAALPPPLRTAPTYTLQAAGATYHVAQTTLRPNTATPTQSPDRPLPGRVLPHPPPRPPRLRRDGLPHRPPDGRRRRLHPARRHHPLPPPAVGPPPRPPPHPRRLGLPRPRRGPAHRLHLRSPPLLALDLAPRMAPRRSRPPLHRP